MNESRGSLYLLTGLFLGLGLGLFIGWVLRPAVEIAYPSALSMEAKDQYRVMIAASYAANQNLPRARARLELLKDADLYGALAEQARRSLAAGRSPEEAQALGNLASALAQGAPPTPLPESQLPVPTAAITGTVEGVLLPVAEPPADQADPASSTGDGLLAQATAASSATSQEPAAPLPTFSAESPSPFVLLRQDLVCDTPRLEPQLQVQALDSTGTPASGVEVVVTWDQGEEHFFTGLKPEFGVGYADFQMEPDLSYTLRLGEGGEPVGGLEAPQCGASGGWGALLLTFQQP